MMPTHPLAVSPPCPSPTHQQVVFYQVLSMCQVPLKQLPGFILIPIPPLQSLAGSSSLCTGQGVPAARASSSADACPEHRRI